MAAAGAEAAAVATAEEEEEKRLPEGDPESGGDSEDEGDSESSGDGEDEEKENEAEIQRLEEQVGPGWAGGGVGRGWWGSTAASARSKPLTRGRWRWRPGRALRRWPARVAMRDASVPGLRGRLVPENQGLSSWRPGHSRFFLFVTACWDSCGGNWKKRNPNSVAAPGV